MRPAEIPLTGVPAPGERSWPLAVGVLAFSPPRDTARWRRERLALALDSYAAGYFLLEVVELRLTDRGLCTGLRALAGLVAATDADALVVRGPLDLAAVEPLAAEARLVVRASTGPTPAGVR